MKSKFILFSIAGAIALTMAGCQKMEKPALGNYPVDANPPDGPLRFYVAFDGAGEDKLRNAVDSVKANFPTQNDFTSTSGISGNAAQGVSGGLIKYGSFNGWTSSSSFTFSSWFKKNGQTKNNLGDNGPEYIMSLRAEGGYHWSDAVMFVFLEGNNEGCAVKVMAVSPSDPANPNSSPADNWFTWEGGQVIPGLLDDQWHHLVLTYDETTSSMKLFIDGVQNPNVKVWGDHGALRLSTTKINEYRIGRGPRNDSDGDGAGGWLQSSFKGAIDQIRMYNAVLSDADITALYNSHR